MEWCYEGNSKMLIVGEGSYVEIVGYVGEIR